MISRTYALHSTEFTCSPFLYFAKSYSCLRFDAGLFPGGCGELMELALGIQVRCRRVRYTEFHEHVIRPNRQHIPDPADRKTKGRVRFPACLRPLHKLADASMSSAGRRVLEEMV